MFLEGKTVSQFVFEKTFGVKREHPRNLVALTSLLVACNVYAKMTGLEIQASAPDEGAIIFIFNHLDSKDLLRLVYAFQHYARNENGDHILGRIPRGVVKSTIFAIPEPENVRQKIGKKDILNSDNPLNRGAIRFGLGPFLRANGFIPIIRGTNDRAAVAEINNALALGQGLGSSIMESRDKTGGLKGLKTGAALLLKTHPDTPFQLLGISRHPHRVRGSSLQTYAAIKEQRGDLSLRDLTMFLADGIVEMLPEPIQERWRSGERQTEYQALYPRRIQTPTSNP